MISGLRCLVPHFLCWILFENGYTLPHMSISHSDSAPNHSSTFVYNVFVRSAQQFKSLYLMVVLSK